MCQPSVYQWGPICNFGMDSVCLVDAPGATQPLAVHVNERDPFPSDGGGAWQAGLGQVKDSIFFSRRPDNPFSTASFAYVPYCTGDLHAGAATKTYFVKPGPFDQPMPRTHRFAGAANFDAYLAWLVARHPSPRVVWVIGVSGGGYGAQLNLHRVRAAFPVAQVHLLADSAPMVDSLYFQAFRNEWNLQVPAACTTCDGGLPAIVEHQARSTPNSRVALLATTEDAVITRFFLAPANTGGWAAPPYATYTAALTRIQTLYDGLSNARYFVRPGQDHVMLQGAGIVLADGGVTTPISSPDGGTTLKAWVDAWATGQGAWQSVR
jgi:hypothetical protein